MPTKSSRSAFFVALGFAALAIVIGAAAIFFQFRDHTQSYGVPAIELAVGVVLMTVTLLAESPGRSQRPFIHLRDSLIACFCVAALLVFLYGLVGPLR